MSWQRSLQNGRYLLDGFHSTGLLQIGQFTIVSDIIFPLRIEDKAYVSVLLVVGVALSLSQKEDYFQ